MKQSQFPLFLVCLVFIVGAVYGRYLNTKQGIVSEVIIQTLRTKCTRLRGVESVLCLRQGLRRIMRDTNVGDIMHAVLLDAYHADDPDTVYNSPNCHALAHLVGETAGRASRAPVSRLITMCGTACVYGCVHGMFSGLLKQGRLMPSRVATICAEGVDTPTPSNDHEQCVHGIGHGLADYFHNDVPRAIALCDTFVGYEDKKICWDGVFMEEYEPVIVQQSGALNSRDLFDGCRQYTGDIRVICMQSVLSVTYHSIREIDQAIGTCEKPLDQFEKCLESIQGSRSSTLEEERFNLYQCRRAIDAMDMCITDSVRAFPRGKNIDEQVNSVCQKNGIVYRDQCSAYIKKLIE